MARGYVLALAREAETAGRCRGLYAGASASDVDPKVTGTDAGRRCGEGRQQLTRPKSELLGDDRGIGLHDDVEPIEPNHAAGAGRRRHALGDDRLERRHRA